MESEGKRSEGGRSDEGRGGGRSELVASLLVFAVAAFCYGLYGNQGRLYHDDAIYFYGGQEAARGVPPYLGIFEHKAPLGQLVFALPAWLAGILGTDDLLAARWMSLLAAAATLALLHRLAVALFGSRAQGFVTAAGMIACWGYGIYAFSGTRPKLFTVLFQVAMLLATVRGRWFRAGLWGGLAGWTWQPTALFGLLAVPVAGLAAAEGRRLAAAGRVLAGLLVPTVGLLAYYAAHGAVGDLLDGALLFNVQYLDQPATPRQNLFAMYKVVTFTKMGFSVALGLLAVLCLYPWRLRAAGGLRGLARDPFLIVLLTFPLPFAWSLLDFQSYPDFFVFLPYALLGFGWLVAMGMEGVASRIGLAGAARTALVSSPALLLALLGGYGYHRFPQPRLAQQREEARALLEACGGPDARLVVIGHPELLVLLGRTNPTRYGFIMRGIREYIDDHEPGGFAGWLRSLDEARPDAYVLDERYGDQLGPFAPAWREWIAGLERGERFGRWRVFLPRASPEGAPGG